MTGLAVLDSSKALNDLSIDGVVEFLKVTGGMSMRAAAGKVLCKCCLDLPVTNHFLYDAGFDR